MIRPGEVVDPITVNGRGGGFLRCFVTSEGGGPYVFVVPDGGIHPTGTTTNGGSDGQSEPFPTTDSF